MAMLARALGLVVGVIAGHTAWTSFSNGQVKILYKQFLPFTFSREQDPFLFWFWIIAFTVVSVVLLVSVIYNGDD